MGKGRDKGVRIGNMDLARRADRKKVRDITVSLQLQTENLTRNDLRSWRHAWQQAINVEQPRRNRLYNIYTDVDVDGHLAGCVEQRTGFVMNKGFRIVDRSGAENEDLRELFETPWFKQWMRLSLESIYYGNSLIVWDPSSPWRTSRCSAASA